ncbi:MAG: hypothetical protein ACLQDV_28425 [Candidatus Binataceae bacterium]
MPAILEGDTLALWLGPRTALVIRGLAHRGRHDVRVDVHRRADLVVGEQHGRSGVAEILESEIRVGSGYTGLLFVKSVGNQRIARGGT